MLYCTQFYRLKIKALYVIWCVIADPTVGFYLFINFFFLRNIIQYLKLYYFNFSLLKMLCFFYVFKIPIKLTCLLVTLLLIPIKQISV